MGPADGTRPELWGRNNNYTGRRVRERTPAPGTGYVPAPTCAWVLATADNGQYVHSQVPVKCKRINDLRRYCARTRTRIMSTPQDVGVKRMPSHSRRIRAGSIRARARTPVRGASRQANPWPANGLESGFRFPSARASMHAYAHPGCTVLQRKPPPVRAHTHAYTHTHARIRTHTHTNACEHTHMRMHVHARKRTYAPEQNATRPHTLAPPAKILSSIGSTTCSPFHPLLLALPVRSVACWDFGSRCGSRKESTPHDETVC